MFLAAADEEYGRQIPFAYLDKLKEDFVKAHGETAKSAVANSLQRVYGRVGRGRTPGACRVRAGPHARRRRAGC